jgi:cytoskeletal protein CcmA (bactofilin family)
LVEYELPKLGVAGSNPVARSKPCARGARTLGSPGRKKKMGIFGKTESRPPERATALPPKPAPPSKPSPAKTPPPAPGSSQCVIGAKTVLKGDITGDEDVVVQGTVEGTIRISRDLRVGPGGCVKATVSAQSIVVAGEVIGDCQAAQRVHLEASGKLTGNIRAPRVIIVEGATFKGNSDMSPGGRSGGV